MLEILRHLVYVFNFLLIVNFFLLFSLMRMNGRMNNVRILDEKPTYESKRRIASIFQEMEVEVMYNKTSQGRKKTQNAKNYELELIIKIVITIRKHSQRWHHINKINRYAQAKEAMSREFCAVK